MVAINAVSTRSGYFKVSQAVLNKNDRFTFSPKVVVCEYAKNSLSFRQKERDYGNGEGRIFEDDQFFKDWLVDSTLFGHIPCLYTGAYALEVTC